MIVGMDKLERRLNNMSQVSLSKGIDRSINLVQETAKSLCPVGDGELRESIYTSKEQSGDTVIGNCYTNKQYGPYVELGTGPKGQASHEGISPDVTVSYSQSPWWMHESQIDKGIAEKYHWLYVDTPDGRFYQCSGQPAQPYMYPALKNNEESILNIMKEEARKEL